jgi:hypothetical protein
MVARQPEPAHAEGRVALVPPWYVGERLVGTDVERAHHDPALAEGAEHARVGVALVLRAGRVGAVEQQELRAQQPDALGLQRHVVDVPQAAHVGEQRNRLSVRRPARPVAGRATRRRLLATRRRLRHLLFARIEQHLSRGPVDEHQVAVREHMRLGARGHRGNAELLGQDRGVAGRPTALRHDRSDPLRIEHRGVRRRQVARHQHERVRRIGDPRHRKPEQHSHCAVAQVVEIGRPVGHVALQRLKHAPVLGERVRDRVQPVSPGAHPRLHAFPEHRVTCDQRLREEDAARRLRRGRGAALELCSRRPGRVGRPRHLGLEIRDKRPYGSGAMGAQAGQVLLEIEFEVRDCVGVVLHSVSSKSSSRMCQTGSQYTPVASIATCVTAPSLPSRLLPIRSTEMPLGGPPRQTSLMSVLKGDNPVHRGRTLRQTSHGRTGTKEKTTSTSDPGILPHFTDPRTAERPHN